MNKKVCFLCVGTGGHVLPVRNLIKELKELTSRLKDGDPEAEAKITEIDNEIEEITATKKIKEEKNTLTEKEIYLLQQLAKKK